MVTDFQTIFPAGFDASKYDDRKAWNVTGDPAQALKTEIQNYGMKPPLWLIPDKINRFPDSEDKVGGKAGWCWFTLMKPDNDGTRICVARFGSFRGNPHLVKWCNKNIDYMSNDERTYFESAMAAASKAHEEEIKRNQIEAALRAKEVYTENAQASGLHPYLQKKKVAKYDLRQTSDNRLVIPIYTDKDKLSSLQFIGQDGSKKFLTGGQIKGAWYRFGPDDGKCDVVYIAEGWATGATIHELTLKTVYCAFNANNLLDVTYYARDHESGAIVIAADDDRFKDHNTGLTEAKKVQATIPGVQVILPVFSSSEDKGTDFNDMLISEGRDSTRKILDCVTVVKTVDVSIKVAKAVQEDSKTVIPGSTAINKIYEYYMATSGNHQPGFAMQTALAICSFVCGRYFRTSEDNFSALFFLNVGRTATGKEHCKTVIERVLGAGKLERLISGDGFTSSGAVMSTLLAKPRTISVIDEMGIYLEAMQGSGSGQAREGNAMLMQAFGRCHSVLRPKNYSSMTVAKKAADELKDREVKKPSLTIVGITTPSTFMEAISHKDILSGFLNRFILHSSSAEPDVRMRVADIGVPAAIKNWIEAIQDRIKAIGNAYPMAEEEPEIITLQFADKAVDVQKKYEAECIKKLKELEPHGLDGLVGRANEQAMRISLIHALARDPLADIILQEDMEFGINYMRTALNTMIELVTANMRFGQNDKKAQDVLDEIRNAGSGGILLPDLAKTRAARSVTKRELDDILKMLADGEFITQETTRSSRGRPTAKYKIVD